jgi:hypothetical protein
MAGCYTRPSTGGGTIEIQLDEHANLANLKTAIEKVVLRVGTIECGIGGYDMRIVPANAAKQGGKLEEIAPGIKAVTHSR